MHGAALHAAIDLFADRVRLVASGRVDYFDDLQQIQPTARGGLIVNAWHNGAIKLLYGRGFRAPTLLDLYPTSPTTQIDPDLAPETLDSYELVLMHREKDLHLELIAYHMRWHNGLEIIAVDNYSLFTNVGLAASYGIEANAEVRIDHLTLRGAMSLTRGERIKPEKRSFQTFPRYSSVASAEYDLFGGSVSLFAMGHFHAGWHETTRTDAPKLASYMRFDAGARYHFLSGDRTFLGLSMIDLQIAANDLFDQRRRIPSPLDIAGGSLTEGLTVNASLFLGL